MNCKTFACGAALLVAATPAFLAPPRVHAQPPRGLRAPIAPARSPAMNFAASAVRPVDGLYYGGYRFGFAGGLLYQRYALGGYHGWYPGLAYSWGAHYPYYGGYAGYYPYYGGYGDYYPYYGGYASYYPPTYYANPYYGNNPYDYSYRSIGSLTGPAAAGPDYQPAPAASAVPSQSDNRAHVTVTVPPSAKVWFDGTATTSTGPVRQFVTPPLEAGQQYTLWVRARWAENGREVNQLQPVDVTAGAHYNVQFSTTSKTGG